MNSFNMLLQFIGIITIIFAIVIILIITTEHIINKIKDFKWKYKYKHRFDNPPTAKCYCVDCRYYKINDKICNRHFVYNDDNSFCSEAIPREHNIDSEVINNE